MKSLRFALAVFGPLLVIAVWVARIELVVQGGALMHLRVTGYDPRDLLAGHYLQYRFQFDEIDPCTDSREGERCVCAGESNSSLTISAVTWGGVCAEAPQGCGALLRGRCENGRFVAGVERFYFAESMSEHLLTIPEGASVMIKTDARGHGVVIDFLVEGQPLSEYVRSLPSPSPTPPG